MANSSGGSGAGRGPRARRAGAVRTEPIAPTIQVFTVRAPDGQLVQVLQISDGSGMMTQAMQLGERERAALASAFSQPLSDIVVARPGDVPGMSGNGNIGAV